jgi:hypothetical protein
LDACEELCRRPLRSMLMTTMIVVTMLRLLLFHCGLQRFCT